MKTNNTRASGTRSQVQRLAALGAITLLSAFLIACGGGGGGGAVGSGGATAPVTPTVPVVTPTIPVVTPPVTVSVTCPNTNPVVVVQGSNANDYTNCPVVVPPVVTAAAACAASNGGPTATTYRTLVNATCVTVNRAINTATGLPNKVPGSALQLITSTNVNDSKWNEEAAAGKIQWFELQNVNSGAPIHVVPQYLRPQLVNTSATWVCGGPVVITTGNSFSELTSSTLGCGAISIDYIVTNVASIVVRIFDLSSGQASCVEQKFDSFGGWAPARFAGSPAICTP